MSDGIDWSLLHTPDFVGNYLAGAKAGDQMQQQVLTRDVLHGLDMNDPDALSKASNALIRGGALKEAAAVNEIAAKAQSRDLLNTGKRLWLQNRGGGSTPAAATPSTPAPAASPASVDMSAMTPEQLQTVSGHATDLHDFTTHLETLPYAQRKAVIDANSPALQAKGFTPQQIAGVDPTNQYLAGVKSELAPLMRLRAPEAGSAPVQQQPTFQASQRSAGAPTSAPSSSATNSAGFDLQRDGRALGLLALGGMNVDPLIAISKATAPDVTNVNGFMVDKNDKANVGKYFPQIPQGAEPLYDSEHRIVGIRTMDGAVQSMHDLAKATKAGQNEADLATAGPIAAVTKKAQGFYEPDDRTDENGAPYYGVKSDRYSGAAGAGGLHGQSPSARELSVAHAKTQGERDAGAPKATAGLQDQGRANKVVVDAIDRALPMIGRWTAGLGSNLAGIKGTPAHDLQAVLDTIRANVGFDRLQAMRDNSPTGGALGQVSEQENRLLQSVQGSLDAGQSPEQLKANLTKIRGQLVAIGRQRDQLYQSQYGAGAQVGHATSGGGFSITPEMARAELARRRGGQ